MAHLAAPLILVSLAFLYITGGAFSSRLRLTPSKLHPGWDLVEVYHSGQWGTLCDDYVGSFINIGRVICRQIGSTNLTRISSPTYITEPSIYDASISEQIWLDDIKCTGTESNIDECNHRAWGSHNCGHYEDIYVQCGSCSVQHCQTGKSVCNSNGATCSECTPPYIAEGLNRGCRKPICVPACKNNGTCIADNTCRCQAGYQGRLCELGGKLDENLKPRLHVVEDDILSPLAWYDNPKISNNNRLCFVKIGIQGSSLDTILTAVSLNSADELYGNYTMGPVDAKAEVNGTTRVACLQFRCPSFDRNGSEQYTNVRVTVSASYGTCRISPNSFKLSNVTIIPSSGAHDTLQFTLQPGNNYGPYFGIYISQGYRDKAKYIAERSCFCGRDYRIDGIHPLKNTLANFVCA